MQNAAFNPVYRKWEVCKAFVQLLFCKDFDKCSTFAMIRVKEDTGPEQFYWVILTAFCSVETLPTVALKQRQVGLRHVTLAVEHVADSWDVHFCRVKYAMALINLIETIYIKRKTKTHVIDHMSYDGLHTKSSRLNAPNTGFIMKNSLIFSFTENSSDPRQELFSSKNNSFPFI